MSTVTVTNFQDSFSQEVWASTYKDHKDDTIDDTFRRVANFAAGAEETEELKQEWSENFFKLLSNFTATAGGRIYSNAGTDWKGTTLMNCFVSPRASSDIDSLNGIIDTLKSQANTLKSEGGWGENFSYIRPRGSFIHGIGVESPGAVKYMEMFDTVSDIITAGSGVKSQNKKAKGKIRKGAMMGVLDVWHPDIIEFITAKQSAGRLSKFNVSVNCTDEFMKKVIDCLNLMNEHNVPEEELGDLVNWDLRFPDTTHKSYKKEWDGSITNWVDAGYPIVVIRTVSVIWLWNLIMESTYNRAEPGVLFLDRANYFNPLNYRDTISATNPCGEQVLAPGGVCNLGSLNLTQFLNRTNTNFDYKKLEIYVRYLNRFLDNINSLSQAPLPEYTDSMRHKRRVGIGILGWGSALLMLKVRFGSEKAAELREKLMTTISREAYMSSIDLADEKGMFKYCEPEKHAESPFIKNLDLSDYYMEKLRTIGIRNSAILSIQPTGNTSIFANVVSGGLEPIFMPEYIRTVIVNAMPEEIVDVCPKWFEGEWFETELFKKAKEGDEEILRGIFEGTIYKIDKNRGLTKEVLCEDYGVRWLKARGEWDPKADWAVTTTELSVEDHVGDLAGFAKWIDSAISKTINVPNKYPFDKFKNIYIDTYKSGYVKGVTTYRSGTMTSVLSATEEKQADQFDEEIVVEDVKLPDSAPAVMKILRAEGRKWYLTVVFHDTDQSRPFALFVKTNSHEKTVVADEAVDVLLKLARKKKIPKRHLDAVTEKIGTDTNSSKVARLISFLLRHGVLIKNVVASLEQVESAYVGTFVYQIRKFLSSYIKDGEKSDESCGECGGTVVYSEGCFKCVNCGVSKC